MTVTKPEVGPDYVTPAEPEVGVDHLTPPNLKWALRRHLGA